MNLLPIPYLHYEKGLPQTGNVILGQTRGENVIVYQAFNDPIADYAVKNQRFGGPHYSFARMTWLKPNFLWMMYRSGWASKADQTRILAIEIALADFEQLLAEGVLSSFHPQQGEEATWRKSLENSEVRIQWDPDHGPQGEKLSRRAVQIGIKGAALRKFNRKMIRSVTDITDFVKKQKLHLEQNFAALAVMYEQIVPVNDELKNKFAIPATFVSPFAQRLVDEFAATQTIQAADFEALLTDGGQHRPEWVAYVRNYQHPTLARYLLKTAIAYRTGQLGARTCQLEDLSLFCYFASKGGTEADFDLILQAKRADFDTWSGLDGELVFYPLGFAEGKAYLQKNIDKFSQPVVDHFLEFEEADFHQYLQTAGFGYFGSK
jgi:hypothetical protein